MNPLTHASDSLINAINELTRRKDEEENAGDLQSAKVTGARIEKLYEAHRAVSFVAIAEAF